jgi:hypothetical protein
MSRSLGLRTRHQLLNLLNETKTCGIHPECMRKLMERFIQYSRRLMREMNRVPLSRCKTNTAAPPGLARYFYTAYYTSHLSYKACFFVNLTTLCQSQVLYRANKLWHDHLGRIRNEPAGICFKTLPHWHEGLRRAGVLHRSSEVHAPLVPELLARPARPGPAHWQCHYNGILVPAQLITETRSHTEGMEADLHPFPNSSINWGLGLWSKGHAVA